MSFFYRLSALKSLLHNILQAEDTIKVNEARLTEKETSSLDLKEVANYRSTLKVCHLFLSGCYLRVHLLYTLCFPVLANEK